jgi:hypothetical protein
MKTEHEFIKHPCSDRTMQFYDVVGLTSGMIIGQWTVIPKSLYNHHRNNMKRIYTMAPFKNHGDPNFRKTL